MKWKTKTYSHPHEQALGKTTVQLTIHIFTLFSLIKKAISKGNYLYTCFVDFRKAYDSICRNCLLYRLKERGLIRKILDTIKSMYKSPKISLIHQDEISPTFLKTIDLKQGDVLSTILFNIYKTDLPVR